MYISKICPCEMMRITLYKLELIIPILSRSHCTYEPMALTNQTFNKLMWICTSLSRCLPSCFSIFLFYTSMDTVIKATEDRASGWAGLLVRPAMHFIGKSCYWFSDSQFIKHSNSLNRHNAFPEFMRRKLLFM